MAYGIAGNRGARLGWHFPSSAMAAVLVSELPALLAGRKLTPMGKPSIGAQIGIGLLRKRLIRDPQEMADALGLDDEEMADLEAGRRPASAGDVAAAAEFLRVS